MINITRYFLWREKKQEGKKKDKNILYFKYCIITEQEKKNYTINNISILE